MPSSTKQNWYLICLLLYTTLAFVLMLNHFISPQASKPHIPNPLPLDISSDNLLPVTSLLQFQQIINDSNDYTPLTPTLFDLHINTTFNYHRFAAILERLIHESMKITHNATNRNPNFNFIIHNERRTIEFAADGSLRGIGNVLRSHPPELYKSPTRNNTKNVRSTRARKCTLDTHASLGLPAL